MKHKEIKSIVEKEVDALSQYAAKILARDDAEDIHRFRVGYKKLRAFLRLQHIGQGNNPLKQLKHIYTAAGQVRDIQIFHKTINARLEQERHRVGVYPGILKQEIEVGTQQLQETIRNFSFQGLAEKLIDALPRHTDDNTIIQFVHQQAEGFYSNIKDDATDEQLHTARKHLKDIIYNAAYLRADKKDALFLEQKKAIKKLATLLGNYNDKHMLIVQLQTVPEEKIPVEEKESLRHMEEEQGAEKALLKKDIVKVLNELLSKAEQQSLSGVKQAGLLLSSALASGLAVFFLNYMRRGD